MPADLGPAGREPPSHPWYREPWVWGLISGPAIVVVAGFITAWLAIRSNDGLVVDDYYKRGLAIHEVVERDRAAQALGLAARVALAPAGGSVTLQLTAERGALPATLGLRIVHPTRAGLDQELTLERVAPGRYQGAMAPVRAGRWVLKLQDPGQTWRLMGSTWVPDATVAELKPVATPDS
jgi:hypothetical protein